MRHFLDRALDSYPDYPPGFRPVDLEPRDLEREKYDCHRYRPMNADDSMWEWLYWVRLHSCLICVGVV